MGMSREAVLPTYRTSAAVLEGQNGSGLRLAGWTVARMVMIVPPLLAVGIDSRRALIGAGLASVMISGFTLLRILNAGPDSQLMGRKSLAGARRRRR